MAKNQRKASRTRRPRTGGETLSLDSRKAIVGSVAFLLGVLFLRRAFAAKGEVYIDEVRVQKAEWTKADQEAAYLTSLHRHAKELLRVDPDTMSPTKRPTPVEQTQIQEAIDRLRMAGRTGESDFLKTLLSEAKELPLA
jgi:hypothetical protein